MAGEPGHTRGISATSRTGSAGASTARSTLGTYRRPRPGPPPRRGSRRLPQPRRPPGGGPGRDRPRAVRDDPSFPRRQRPGRPVPGPRRAPPSPRRYDVRAAGVDRPCGTPGRRTSRASLDSAKAVSRPGAPRSPRRWNGRRACRSTLPQRSPTSRRPGSNVPAGRVATLRPRASSRFAGTAHYVGRNRSRRYRGAASASAGGPQSARGGGCGATDLGDRLGSAVRRRRTLRTARALRGGDRLRPVSYRVREGPSHPPRLILSQPGTFGSGGSGSPSNGQGQAL